MMSVLEAISPELLQMRNADNLVAINLGTTIAFYEK